MIASSEVKLLTLVNSSGAEFFCGQLVPAARSELDFEVEGLARQAEMESLRYNDGSSWFATAASTLKYPIAPPQVGLLTRVSKKTAGTILARAKCTFWTAVRGKVGRVRKVPSSIPRKPSRETWNKPSKRTFWTAVRGNAASGSFRPRLPKTRCVARGWPAADVAKIPSPNFREICPQTRRAASPEGLAFLVGSERGPLGKK